MAEETTKSQAEIDADVELKLATAEEKRALVRKLEEETRRAAFETLKAEQEALKVTKEADLASIYVADARRTEQKLLATDEYHHVYRFATQVSETSVKTCMQKLAEWDRLDPGCEMEIVFSSPGGSIIPGMMLFDYIQELRAKGHRVTTGCAGMAASMAGILLQAGDHRWVGEQSWVMIHRAAFGAAGKTYEVEDEVDFVKRIEERIVRIFTTRSKLTPRKIKSSWDRKDWWIDAEQALELGLVDEIRGKLNAQP